MSDAELLRRLQTVERRLASAEHATGTRASGWDVSPARLWAALIGARWGGGRLVWTVTATGRQNYGHGGTAWSDLNMDASNYTAVLPSAANEYAGGGPYMVLNGTDEALSIGDASWQEAGTEELLVWQWCYATGLASNIAVASKWLTTGDQRSWLLNYQVSYAAFRWTCNATGLSADNVGLSSAHAALANTWYFVAGYVSPGSVMRIYCAAAGETEVTVDTLSTGVPTSLYNTTASLVVGAIADPAQYWAGRIGIGAGWLNVLPDRVDDYVQWLFRETEWAYRE